MKRRICRTGCGVGSQGLEAVRPLSVEETRRLIEDYASWDVVVNTGESVLEALTMESRYKISFWDALILQATGSAGGPSIRR
jgi:predicted nucleic acid-binding protein